MTAALWLLGIFAYVVLIGVNVALWHAYFLEVGREDLAGNAFLVSPFFMPISLPLLIGIRLAQRFSHAVQRQDQHIQARRLEQELFGSYRPEPPIVPNPFNQGSLG